MEISDLPALNALLNSTAFVLLIAGWLSIRAGRKKAHGWFMGSAFLTSCIFLVSYLVYHAMAGHQQFQGHGWIRPVYFFILITHILLAFVVAPLALTAVWHAVRRRWDRHVRITRVLLPIWLYVSISGVLIYLLLYQLSST
jgi:putative membrane protein